MSYQRLKSAVCPFALVESSMSILAFFSCTGGEGSDGGVEPWSCEGESVWEDPETGLCWMREEAKLVFPDGDTTYYMNWWDATTVCSNLDWDGYSDWRLPEIQELVGLVRGCPSESCPVHDPDCLLITCDDAIQCEECEPREGPGEEGCYWPGEMGPECPFYYWSDSTSLPYAELVWTLDFSIAGIYPWNRNVNTWPVRCVRSD
jgi:hypothetical protein